MNSTLITALRKTAVLLSILPLIGLAADLPDYPDVITVERGGFTPEGIEYDNRNQRFMLGSVVEGKVFAMDAQGRLTAVVEDPQLGAVVGVEVDEQHNRILVANADASVFGSENTGFAKLGVYDLDSGERIAMVDLGAAYADAPAGTQFFPNDLVTDPAGNVYITDSFAVVVYKVDTQYQPSVFVPRDKFPENQSLNGIVSHLGGYLLVAGSGTGVLYRVAVTNPDIFAPVGTSELIHGADGMVWAADGTLAIAARGRTVALHSDDNWTSARVVKEAEQGAASTVAAVGDELYLVFPHFSDQQPPTVERVQFPDQ